MNIEKQNLKPIRFIRNLCNHKTEQEILEAEYNFREYILVVKEICDRLVAEGKSLRTLRININSGKI
ncbi:MAG: hypothetical protein IPL31_10540 [Saprospiraceae bacterium]|nr:hypothetical protein [Saprospiraceae bacterium]